MSKELLHHLNSNKNGSFKAFIDGFNDTDPVIAWYPSAGQDFRDVMYCSAAYSSFNPASVQEPTAPDLYIHTDYFPWTRSTFLDNKKLYEDHKSSITLLSIEDLGSVSLHVDERIVDFPQGSVATNKVLFLQLQVTSTVLGSFTVPVLYVFAENAAFCAEVLLKYNANISRVLNIRHGGGLGGGGKSTGKWLLNVLERLNCQLYIADSYDVEEDSNKDIACELYPELRNEENSVKLNTIRTIASEKWSDYGDVQWLKAK